jgi:hypothetical protein
MNQHPTTQTDPETGSRAAVAFPPIPLVAGEALVDEHGRDHEVTDVRITITTATGATAEVTLEYKFGGWWAPAGPILPDVAA